jgi:hypothetical protein
MRIRIEAASREEFESKRAELVKALLTLSYDDLAAPGALEKAGAPARLPKVDAKPSQTDPSTQGRSHMGGRAVNTGVAGASIVFGSPGPQEAPKTSEQVKDAVRDAQEEQTDESVQNRRPLEIEDLTEAYARNDPQKTFPFKKDNAYEPGHVEAREEQRRVTRQRAQQRVDYRRDAAETNPSRLQGKQTERLYVRRERTPAEKTAEDQQTTHGGM